MLEALLSAWRARRVLLIGGPDAQLCSIRALLSALGARPSCIPADSGAAALNRAMREGRVSAVIIPSAHALRTDGSLFDQLHTLDLILRETREAGIPLLLLCSHGDVYLPQDAPAQEDAPIGGRTREGFIQSALQLLARGYSRGMMGDPVASIICRHPPCLGSGHANTAQYSRWCRDILRGQTPVLEHPGASGTFFHPLDAMLGALCAGACFFEGNPAASGCFNIAPEAKNRCANRSAYLSLAAAEGATRAPREAHPPRPAQQTLLCGNRLRRLCGYCAMLDARQALAFLMETERALAVGQEAALAALSAQAQALLEAMK